MPPPQVVFRAMDYDETPRLYVAYLWRNPKGDYFAVLSEDEQGYGLRHSAKLDPSRLLEQRDDVSEQPFYLYSGIVDIRPKESQKLGLP
jgi:hypothetical protein